MTTAADRARIEADLAETARYARRQPCLLGTEGHPSAWDDAHRYLDLLLSDWQAQA